MLWESSQPLSSLPGWKTEDFKGFSSLYDKALQAKFPLLRKPFGGLWEEFLNHHFESRPCSENGLLTGYYGPTLKGAKNPSERFSTPLYCLPEGKQDRGLTRKEIYQGALSQKGRVLCFVENKIEAFFLEIQGSGRIELENGEHFYAAYTGQNGHPYRALGAVLLEKRLMKKEDISMESLKQFLLKNPGQAESLMEENPSFVYFQENQEGVLGTSGVFLEAGRSLAVDEKIIPLGSLVWVETKLHDGTLFQKLMIALDTGGAIKGPGRGDIFFGFGKEAERLAGHQNSSGRMFLLTPKGQKPS